MSSLVAPLQKFATNSLEQHWEPFTANRAFKADPRLIVKSEGVHLWDHKGGKIIDGSSALFNVAAGHGRREIADAVHAQMLENDYTPHFQIGHPGSYAFAARLAKILPEPINHVFFVNSGSESIDTAMKIAFAYHRAHGDDRRLRLISRERAYHGVNMGGVSLAGLVKNREQFPVTLPNVVMMRHTWLDENRFQRGQPETGAELANDLQRFCDFYGGDTIAAVFIEPVAGSTGCLPPPKGYLERVREICDKYGILLVFDEVITGFGRLGTPFAADYFGVVPDIMTMAKALTNGAIPMGAVAVKDDVYTTITEAAPEGAIEFFHGYTYSAHPAACAAGLVTLDIYEREGLLTRAAELTDYFLDGIWSLKSNDVVFDLRGIGLMAAVEVAPKPGAPGARGGELTKKLFWSGLHVKFTGDAGIVAPPLTIEKSEIDRIVEIFDKTLKTL